MTNQNDKLDEILDRFFRTFWETPSLTYEQAKKQAEEAILNWAKKEWNNKKAQVGSDETSEINILKRFIGMSVESLSPDNIEKLGEIIKELTITRLKVKEGYVLQVFSDYWLVWEEGNWRGTIPIQKE